MSQRLQKDFNDIVMTRKTYEMPGAQKPELGSSLQQTLDDMLPGRLCSRCLAIFDTELDNQRFTDFDHYDDGDSFIKIAETMSCYFCTWIWRSYKDDVRHDSSTRPEIHHVSGEFYKIDGNLRQINFDVHEGTTGVRFRTTASFRAQKEYNQSESHNMLRCFIAKAPDLHASAHQGSLDTSIPFEQARKWLHECNLNHPECQRWRDQRTLAPKRLVHVRRAMESPGVVANICRSETLPITTTYLTLSHCWGKFTFLTTTCENLPQFELQLPVDLLSQTIQDALLVTLEMGFDYIWVDSLCIVQDSAEDWTHEAALMGEVYRNASCNISASAVPDGEHGFLPARNFDPTPITAQIRRRSKQEFDIKETVCETYYFFFDNPAIEIARGPLFERAWILQEQLLASRALHFGTDQMFWECKRTFANEVWPQGWEAENTAPFDTGRSIWEHIWQFSIDDLPTDRIACYNSWYKIVADYSARYVTYESDWLPAIDGLASKFATVLEDTYVHGLWSRDLHRGILFRQAYIAGEDMSTHDPTPIPKWHDVPSWSWAALHKPTSLYSFSLLADEIKRLCKLELVHVSGASMLRLSGMLVSLMSADFHSMSVTTLGEKLSVRGNQGGEDGLTIVLTPDAWAFATFEEDWRQTYDAISSRVPTSELHGLRAAVLFIPVALTSYPDGPEVILGLLLWEQPGLKSGHYRRAGLASMLVGVGRSGSKSLMDTLIAYAQPLVEPNVHEVLEDGRYVITVV